MKLLDFLLLQVPTESEETLRSVLASYEEPTRFYHNLQHIEDGIKIYFDLFKGPFPPVDLFAWVYHDSIYDSTRNDNERRSADRFHADSKILGFNSDDSDRVYEIIMSTDINRTPTGIINDLDLSPLGASSKAYDTNRDNIRKEYGWVDDETWKHGRSLVLESLLNRKLYQTEVFKERFEAQAKRNLRRELKSLQE